MASKKARVRRGRSGARGAAPRLAPEEIAPLALELYRAAGALLTHYGARRADLKGAFERSQRAGPVAPASLTIVNEHRPVSNLLLAWGEELPYLDESGKPRVLDIQGRGATFESLAKRFFPGRPVGEVVELAGRFGNAGVLSGGKKIALYGDAVVNLARLPQSTLAHIIRHVQQMIETCLYNAKHVRAGKFGRIERIVSRPVNPEEFEKFNRLVRPQIHDLCEHVDRLLNSSTRGASRRRRDSATAGIGVYVYYNGQVKRTQSRAREELGE